MRKNILIIFGLALGCRLAWVLAFHPTPISDFHWYFQSATDLSENRGYRIRGELTAFWPVGYAFFLSLVFRVFGASLWVAKATNIVLGLAMIGQTIWMLKLFRRGWKCMVAAGLFMALYVNHIAYSALVSSELLFAVTILSALLLLLHNRSFKGQVFLAGVFFGLACLIKPQALILPALWCASVFFCNRKDLFPAIRTGLVLYLGLLLITTPWTLRNYRLFGEPVFVSTNGGINLLIGNHEEATGSFYFDEEGALKKDLMQVQDEVERSREASRQAVAYMKANPRDTILRIPKKIYYMYYKDVEGVYWNRIGTQDIRPGQQTMLLVFTALAQAMYFALIVSALLGIRQWSLRSPEHKMFLVFTGLCVLYFTALAMVFFGSTRFHFPLIPLAVVIAAPFWSDIASKWGKAP